MPPPELLPQPPQALAAVDPDWWQLDRSYVFLNHGSFGSVPRPVRDSQARWRDAIEARPIELLGRRCRELLATARETVARFLRADPDGLGFVTNATDGVNAAMRSLALRPGDVVLTTDHAYFAVLQTLRHICNAAGAELRIATVPLPLESPRQVLDALAAATDARTRLIVVDHVTSPTALVFPIEEINRMAAARGITVLVDGAHAPGMLDLSIDEVGSAFYAGNLHKWTFAPKGSGFLWADGARRPHTHPTVISHFLGEGFTTEFDWQGTRDISGWLAAADSVTFWEEVGWDAVREHNHALAVWAQRFLCDRWEVEPSSPENGSMLGSMASLPLPREVRARFPRAEDFQACLYDRHRIEVPIFEWGGAWLCRVSCQVYNRPEDYERLADAVLAERG